MKTLSFVGQHLQIASENDAIPRLISIRKTEQNREKTGITIYTGETDFEDIIFANCSTDGETPFANLAALDVWLKAGIATLYEQTILNQNVGGYTNIVGVELTRPADTNAYIALDVLANSVGAPTIITFADIAKVNGGSGYLTKLRAMTDQKTFTGRIRLHLYSANPGAIADNSPFLLLYANKDKRIGHIDLPAFSTEDPTNSTAARSQNYDVRMSFACAIGSKAIYAIAELLDAVAAPANGQKFYFELTAENNA